MRMAVMLSVMFMYCYWCILDHFFTSSSDVTVSKACFIYDSGTVLYDSDGIGASAAVEIAHVDGDAVQVDDIVFV